VPPASSGLHPFREAADFVTSIDLGNPIDPPTTLLADGDLLWMSAWWKNYLFY
jgi:hypothetical protein